MGNIGVSQGSFAEQLTIIEVEFGSECSFVGDKAFNGCSSLEKINEGNVIEEIGASAFAGTNIKSVQFNELTKLGSNAFDSCSNLENISIPICKDIPEKAFKNCTSLKSISISPFGEVVEIGERAFQGCTSLSNANIDNSDTKIGAGAFQGCTSLSNLKLNNCIEIGNSAFSGCTDLTQIDLSKCSSIPEKAFFNCTNLKKIYIRKYDVKCTLDDVNAFYCDDESSEQNEKKIEGFKVYVPRDYLDSYKGDKNWREYNIVYIVEPNQIMYNSSDEVIIGNSEGEDSNGSYDSDGIVRYTNTYDKDDNYGLIEFDNALLSLNDQIFKDSKTLLNVELPSKCKRIGEYEFSGCIKLVSIGFQDDTELEYIDDFAFQNCESLTEFTIPQSVKSLGDGVFDGCVGIKKFEGKFATYNGKAVVCNGKLIHVLNIDNHRRLNISDIDSNITHLGKKCFRGHESLRRVDIPKSITSIGDNAFEDCKNIYEIHFAGETPATLGEDVFKNVPKDKDFKILVPEASFEKYYEKWKDYSIWDHVYPKPESKSMIYFTTNNEAVSPNENYKDYVINPEPINKGNRTYFKITSKNNNVTYIPSNFLSGKPSISKVIISEDITSIGDNAFSGCSNLDYIYLSDNILFLGAYCFKGNGITRIHLPEPPEGKKLQYGINPFAGCSNLEEFVAYQGEYTSADNRCYIDYVNDNSILRCFAPADPDGKTEYQIPKGIEKIGNYTFNSCDGLTSITISNDVTEIGNYSFKDCTNLKNVTIGNSVTSIGISVFDGCSRLTGVTIGNSVTSIGGDAFRFCTSLTSVTIGDSVTDIGQSAFSDCSSLTSITIPDSVISIGDAAFAACSSLKNVTIGNSVTSIGGGAFSGCSSLTSVTIPDSVTEIGRDAFYNCTSLTSVTIGNSVTSIGDSAFEDCSSLAEVYCKPITPPTGSSAMFISNASGRKIYVPSNSVKEYKSAKYWSDYSLDIVGFNFDTNEADRPYNEIWYTSSDENIVIPIETDVFGANIVSNTYENGKGIIKFDSDITSIGKYAFQGCRSLTSITIGNGVTSIGEHAFGDCSSLTTITIPDSVISIGDLAFSGCDSLTSVTIPDSVTSIGNEAFYECTSLTSVTIPNSVTSIGGGAFYYCSSLTSVTIPDSVTSIGDSAFLYCSSLTAFYGKYASADKRCLIIDGVLNSFVPVGLTSYTIPDSVTSIGNSAFYSCSSLTSVTIPNSVTEIGSQAFRYCTSLTSVTIPDSVTSIGYESFEGCSSLTSITIPDSVTSIGSYAFRGCSSLTEVYCKPTTPPAGGYYMFYNNASGRKIYVPRASVSAYKSAEYWKNYASDIVGTEFPIENNEI